MCTLILGGLMSIKIIEDPTEVLRRERERVCFSVINRGKLWYDSLTFEQLSELRDWYRKWLNVTVTFEIPNAPTWLNDKISEEEILL